MSVEVSVVHRRNVLLKEWIDSTFGGAEERSIAWQTFRKIQELHPDIADCIRGDVIGVSHG